MAVDSWEAARKGLECDFYVVPTG
eukprot:COSAG02_NODE_30557_length_549_cov_0.548889_1_plen_23_part_01